MPDFDAPGHQFKIEWTDPGATEGPEIQIGRYSPTPAANDAAGVLRFMANDASGNAQTYVKFRSIIDDPTDGSEDGSLEFTVARGGALVEAFRAEGIRAALILSTFSLFTSGKTVSNLDAAGAELLPDGKVIICRDGGTASGHQSEVDHRQPGRVQLQWHFGGSD